MVADDDLAMVVPEDGLAMVVAPTIPQLGDMTRPIVVEEYIPLPRRSKCIRMMKEKEKEKKEE